MRVLLVSHTAKPCGSNDVVMALLENPPDGSQVRVVFLGDGPVAGAAEALGFEVEVIDAGRARQLHRQPRALARLRKLAKNSDVVFSHVAKSQSLAGWAARLAGTRSVWYQHELPGVPRLLQNLAAASRPALTIANSEFVAAKHRARWPRAKVVVVHPGVQAPDAADCRVHRLDAGATVAVLSRLDRWKRIELSIKAFAEAQLSDRSLQLIVIGGEAGGEQNVGYRAELERLATDSTVENSVKFLGDVPDAKRRFKEIDVLIQLSAGEPFGLSVAESLSYGVPAVVSDDGGIVEIVDDGESGFVVDSESTSAAAASLLRLTGDAELRSAFGDHGRRRVLADLDRKKQSVEIWDQVREASTA